MPKNNVLGKEFDSFVNDYFNEVGEIPTLEEIKFNLLGRGVSFKETSLKTMLSKFRSSKGASGKRGRIRINPIDLYEQIDQKCNEHLKKSNNCISIDELQLFFIGVNPNTLNIHYSKWRNKNGFGRKRGRVSSTSTIMEPKKPSVSQTEEYLFNPRNGRKYRILGIVGDKFELTNEKYGTVFETEINKVLASGYIQCQ
jgi:hypothetical protein